MSPKASQGQMTAASAGEQQQVNTRSPIHGSHQSLRRLTVTSQPVHPWDVVEAADRRINSSQSLVLWLWLQLDYFYSSRLPTLLSLSLSLFSHSPLLSSFRSFALELSALLLFEFGWRSFGSIGPFDCCVHFCCDRKMQNKRTHAKVAPLGLLIPDTK